MTATVQSRRRFLTLSVGGAAAVAVGGGVLRWFAGGYAAQLAGTDAPVALSTKEFAVVRAFVDALLPAAEGFPSGVALGVHQRIDEELWSADARTRDDMKNGLQLFEHAPVLHGFAGRFTALSPDARTAYVYVTLEAKPGALQQVAFALKEMAYLFYYVAPETWRRVGYDGPWVRVNRPPDSQAAYQAAMRRGRSA
jgi:hypothetical protein